jgi:hypothetical protein
MRRLIIVLASVSLAGPVALARQPGPRQVPMGPGFGVPAFEVIGFGGPGFGEAIAGLPFTAEAITETVQTFPDGNRIARQSSSSLARDGQGRVRREQPLPPLGPMGPAPEVTIVTISDPVARVQYMLDMDRKTARQIVFPPDGARGPGPPGPGMRRRPGDRAAGPPVHTESLGM